MLIEIIQQILGIILFFLPGVLLNYIIVRKTEIIERAVYSIVLAPCISLVVGTFLYYLGLLNLVNLVVVLIFLILLFLLIIFQSKEKYQTDFNKDIFYLIFFSVLGGLWRLRFLRSINNFYGSYKYAGIFVGKTVPDLGFYTGIARDHSKFIGVAVFNNLSRYLFVDEFFNLFGTFLITFVFLGFVYLIFSEYKNKKWAFMGVILMSLGPVEIFYTTKSFFGHSFSYLSLFSLFLFYKSKNKKYFLGPLLLSIAMVLSYYTGSIVVILASVGFISALFVRELVRTRSLGRAFKNSLKNRKIYLFLLIVLVVAGYIYLFSSMLAFSIERFQRFSPITERAPTKYEDPTFLMLSAIRWQMLFFFLCGLSFIFYTVKKMKNKERFSKGSLDLLLCLIPVFLVSYAFFHVNLPARIFDYFAFFGLLVLTIPKKYLKIFAVFSFVFLLVSGFYVAEDKKVFFETSNEEIEGALWILFSLQGKVFSDQIFINQLVLRGYYDITGVYDTDSRVYNLFYQDDSSLFLETIDNLNKNLGVDYIVLTKRMQEKYILMLDTPQKPLKNIELYEKNLDKIYDNGDVEIYEIRQFINEK